MSAETSELNQPDNGGDSGEPRRRFGFLHADTGVDEDGVDRDAVTGDVDDEDAVDPQPTFTPADGPVVEGEVVPDDVTGPDGQPEPTTLDDTTLDDTTLDDTTAVPAGVPVSEAAFDANAPLLGDAVGLRASWQQAAAEFVDDPRAAVADAAELVEHTAQTLIGALQQRQRQLRGQWENRTAAGVTGSEGGVGEANGTVDTEELRHLMQSYRALFNQLTSS
jgi:hypothetical protein